MEKEITKDKPIILFDGVCNFCNSSVNFIIDRNSQKDISFASLQSPVGQKLLNEFHLPTATFNSLVLVQDGHYYTKSTAALKVAKMLDGYWKFLFLFVIVPKFIRDFVYNIIARNRYKWFGKQDHCRLPTPEVRERFLDSVPAKAVNTDTEPPLNQESITPDVVSINSSANPANKQAG